MNLHGHFSTINGVVVFMSNYIEQEAQLVLG